MVLVMIPTSVAFALDIKGTDFNDIIFGSAEKDKIDGKKGNDIILGLGNDVGPQSKEELKGQRGNDELIGDKDVFNPTAPQLGVPGPDKLDGYEGDDFLVGDQGDDELKGGKGKGEDILFGGPDNDLEKAGDGDDELHGGFGDDDLRGEKGDDFLFGDHGDDTLDGGDGQDFLDGGFGNDVLFGGKGADILKGGPGDDDLSGGNSADADPDFMDGGPGFDICRVIELDDTWENCELVLDENTGEIIESIGNNPPTVIIDSPLDGATFEDGVDSIILSVSEASDPEDGDDLTVTWTSPSVVGDLGMGDKDTDVIITAASLGLGMHEIIATVTDSESVDATDSVFITVTDEPVLVDDGFVLSNNESFVPALTEPFMISLDKSLFLKITSDDKIHYSTLTHPDDHVKKVEFEIKVGKIKVKGQSFTQVSPGVFTIEVMSSVLNSVFSDGDMGTLKLKIEDDHKNKLEFKNILVTFAP